MAFELDSEFGIFGAARNMLVNFEAEVAFFSPIGSCLGNTSELIEAAEELDLSCELVSSSCLRSDTFGDFEPVRVAGVDRLL